MTNDTISRIEKSMGRARLSNWQFAADGKWDEAYRIGALINEPAKSRWNWVKQQKTNDIALEAIFQLPKNGSFFFGVRLAALDQEAKIRTIHCLVSNCKRDSSLQFVVQNIRTVLNRPDLANTTPAHLELGVFDLWNRVKSLVVWNNNQGDGRSFLISPQRIAELAKQPD